MLQFLVLPIVDLNSSTTIQKKQFSYDTIGCYTTIGPVFEEQEQQLVAPFRKINKSIYTSLSIDEMPKADLSETDLDSNELTRDYEVNFSLPVKKSFIIKAKVKTISKFNPQPYLD